MSQMNLLDWTPPVNVVVFPFDANIGKVRRCAEILERKRGHAADAYWRQVVEPMAQRLERAGVPRVEIRKQVEAFSNAVRQELRRRATYNPKGAA